MWGTVTSFVRLGKSVEELARETIEEIMGYQGKGGHKPARPDIQKMKDVNELFQAKQMDPGEERSTLSPGAQAARTWDDKYSLNQLEQMVVGMYKNIMTRGDMRGDPQKAFEFVVHTLQTSDKGFVGHEADAKRFVGNALKKYEQQNWPMLYRVIDNALADAYRRGPLESYKLWPRMVQWIKDDYQDWLLRREDHGAIPTEEPRAMARQVNHIVDIVTEGGALLDRLRRENRLPQGFDVNRVSFQDFEDWLMQWKRDNREAEAQGEVVYKYDDGWTMQKLTTPEQLQFEGDEMGHCVGGYSNQVENGSNIIYSLRDPKGMPHVTIEIEAIHSLKPMFDKPVNQLGEDEAHQLGQYMQRQSPVMKARYESADEAEQGSQSLSEQPEHAFTEHWVHPEDDPSEAHYKSYGYNGAVPHDKTFEVVQVMGNSNKTPKPEYQRKVKEFLDALRKKGWKFVRSDHWFAPFDDPAQGEYGDGAPSTAQQLDEWYDDHYKTHHEAYRGIGDGDAYGLPAERPTLGVGDWEELFKDCFRSLVDDYDPGRWRGNWRDLAQAVYHAWMIDIYKDHLDPEALEQHRKNLVNEIQDAEQTLHEWNDENWYYAEQHMGDEIAEEVKAEAERRGELPKIEQALDAEYGEDMWDDTELLDWVRDNDDDLYYHATDKARDQATDYYAGDAYKFVQYLIFLAEKHGALNPQDLPNPNDRHGGLPSYEELQEMPWLPDQKQETPVEEGLPGALSSWRMASDPNGGDLHFEPGDRVELPNGGGIGTVIEVQPRDVEDTVWVRVKKDDGQVVVAADWMLRFVQGLEGGVMPDTIPWGEAEQNYYRTASDDIQIHPIDQDHNVWFDEDGNQRERYRPGWAKDPATGKMRQTGELEDTFLDRQGRQGQGWVAYHGDKPIGSLTYVADPAGWNMLGTTYVHPDYREQGLFNRMVAPLREEGKPIDAYVWNNPWLKNKVRGWHQA